MINGLMSTLGDVKNPCTSIKLAIKHALVIVAINSTKSNMSLREKAHVLGVHQHNVSLIIKCHRCMNSIGIFLWTLFIKKRKIDCLNTVIIIVLQAWWVTKTKISPSKRKVTHKQIGPFQDDEKVTHFLMEHK